MMYPCNLFQQLRVTKCEFIIRRFKISATKKYLVVKRFTGVVKFNIINQQSLGKF